VESIRCRLDHWRPHTHAGTLLAHRCAQLCDLRFLDPTRARTRLYGRARPRNRQSHLRERMTMRHGILCQVAGYRLTCFPARPVRPSRWMYCALSLGMPSCTRVTDPCGACVAPRLTALPLLCSGRWMSETSVGEPDGRRSAMPQPSHTHARTDTHRHAQTRTDTHRHAQTRTDTHRHAQTRTDTHRHAQTRTDTDTDTRTCTHAHTPERLP
jgi:hypothetical protein